MYTLKEYEEDLIVMKGLTGSGDNLNTGSEDVFYDSIPGAMFGNIPVREPVDDKRIPKISGNNILLLRRSNFNSVKFRSNLKNELSLDDYDDFTAPFITFWTQLEEEYRKRLYDNFIPNNRDIVFEMLDKAGELRNSCIQDIVEGKKQITFGVVNTVIFAIEKGFRMHDREVLDILSEIFLNFRDDFFVNHSIHNNMKEINFRVRNRVLHKNEVLDKAKYSETCKKLLGQPTIMEWCKAEDKNLFTDYLEMLPGSEGENEIRNLELQVSKFNSTGKDPRGNELVYQMQIKINELKNKLKML